MFSQHDEEQFILDFFKDKTGRFLDLGAYHAEVLSNTRSLVLQGWSGVMVEPCPECYNGLNKIYRRNRKVTLVNKGIATEAGTLPFYNFFGDAIGTFDVNHFKQWSQDGRPYKVIDIPVITIEQLLENVGYDFNFIDIDIEGWSVKVLKTMPLDKLTNLQMVCCAKDNDPQAILNTLEPLGFRQLHQTDENIIMVR